MLQTPSGFDFDFACLPTGSVWHLSLKTSHIMTRSVERRAIHNTSTHSRDDSAMSWQLELSCPKRKLESITRPQKAQQNNRAQPPIAAAKVPICQMLRTCVATFNLKSSLSWNKSVHEQEQQNRKKRGTNSLSKNEHKNTAHPQQWQSFEKKRQGPDSAFYSKHSKSWSRA